MKVYNTSFMMASDERTEICDITKQVSEAIQQFPVTTGIALVNTMHTTCALFINEYQAALIDDLRALVERLVPERNGYRHDDPRYSDCERGNANAHLRAALLGRNIAIGVKEHLPNRTDGVPGARADAGRDGVDALEALIERQADLEADRQCGRLGTLPPRHLELLGREPGPPLGLRPFHPRRAVGVAELVGPEKKRHLRCVRCGSDWTWLVLLCPYCGNDDHRTLRVLQSAGPGSARGSAERVDVCER